MSLDRLRTAIARRIISPQVLAQIEQELIKKTRGEIGRYLLMPGPMLREPEWNFELLKEICDQSFVMEMITRTLTQEVARPGLEIKARFATKCTKCESEFTTKVEKCPQCKSTELREPAPSEWKQLDKILDRPNPEYDWNRILRTIVEDDLKQGNWWLSVTYEDVIDPDTQKLTRRVAEIYLEDPRWMRILADEKGRVRSNDYFCPRCYIKDEHYTPTPEAIASGEQPTCPKCQRPLIMTGYIQQFQGQTTSRWGVEEIIHGSSTQTLPELYGRPRPLSVWKWLLTLNAMLAYTTEIYSSGYVGGFLIFEGLEQDQVNSIKAQIEKEIEAKQVIDVVTGEPQPSLRIRQAWIGTGALEATKPLEARFIASMPDPTKMQSLEWFKFGIEKVTSVFGVTPVFVSIIESGKAGNNPRMQLDVQNRSIQEIQNGTISALNHQLLPRMQIHDWELDFKSIELRDELRETQIEGTKAAAAERWLNAGFNVKIDPNTRELIVSGEGRLGGIEEGWPQEFRLPRATVSEASGAVLEKMPILKQRPIMAIYLVEPHGRMIWTQKKRMVLKTRRYETHENEPLLLIEDGFVYGIIELTNPRQVTWKEFDKLYPQHQVEREEATHWGWDKYETLWAYDVKLIDSYVDPVPVIVPQGVQTFVETRNLRFPESKEIRKAEAIIPGAPEHTHSDVGRGGVKTERGIARKLRSIIMRYHGKEITKDEAMQEAKAALLRHRKTLEAIGLRQFIRMTKQKIGTLPPAVIKRLDEETEKKLEDFSEALDDIRALRGTK